MRSTQSSPMADTVMMPLAAYPFSRKFGRGLPTSSVFPWQFNLPNS